MSNLVTSASRRSAALHPARKPAADWRSRLLALPTRYKVAVLVSVLLAALGWLGLSKHQQSVEPVKLFASKLTPRQVQECSQYLSRLGIDHQPNPDGDNLMVAPEKRLPLLNQLSSEQIPHEDPAGKLNSMGLTPSRREALAREQAELQLSLGATLRSMQGVDNAVVQLAIPESSAFEDNNHPTASVMLTLRSGYDMPQRQATGIAKFVSGAVPSMRQQDVTVVDQTGREQIQNAEGQVDSMQFELQKQLEVYMQGKAQRILDMAYGRGNALAIVNVQFDFSQLEVKNSLGSDEPLIKNISKETYKSDVPEITTFMEEKDEPADASGKKSKTYEKVVEAVRRAPHEALTWRVFKLPRLERVTCAVLLEQKGQSQVAMDLVGNSIGLDESRGDKITASIVPLHREEAGLISIKPAPIPTEHPVSAGPLAWLGLAGALGLGAAIWTVGNRRVRLSQPVLETPKFDGLATQCDLNFHKDGAASPAAETATQPRTLERLEALARQSPKETASLLRSFMDTNTMN